MLMRIPSHFLLSGLRGRSVSRYGGHLAQMERNNVVLR